MDPDFTRRQLQAATTAAVLAQARALSAQVVDLDWDEHSVWGGLGDYGPGDLMLHHGFRPLAGECPCGSRQGRSLCVHITAVALAYLGDGNDLKDALAAMAKADLVALLYDLADRSEQARRVIGDRTTR